MKKLIILLSFVLPAHLLFCQYTDKDIYEYIEQYKGLAVKKMHEFKIPASITLAQGIFESACGTSKLAREGKNHFGIKCHKEWNGPTISIDDDAVGECFRKYRKVEESYDDHSLFLTSRPRYSDLFKLDIMDYKAWAHGLKAAGYATNPKYAERLISLIERYNIAYQDTVYLNEINGTPLAQKNDKNNKAVKIDNNSREIPQASKTAQTNIPKEQKNVQPSPATSLSYFTAKKGDFPTVKYPFSSREVYVNNKTYFVIAREGDTYKKIADDVQDSEKNIRKFNDAQKNQDPQPNEVIYINPKSKSHPSRTHMVQKGETLRFIAQKYGIQLNTLFRYNNLNENSIIYPGNQIKLARQ